MEEKEIINNLKLLQNVEPEKDFVDGTRRLILAAGPSGNKSFGFPRWGWTLAGAVAALLLVVVFVVPQEPRVASLNQQEIERELSGVALDLHMEKVEYRQNVDETIVAALDEISSSQASHMNPSILEEEQDIIDDLEADNVRSQRVGELLNKLTF